MARRTSPWPFSKGVVVFLVSDIGQLSTGAVGAYPHESSTAPLPPPHLLRPIPLAGGQVAVELVRDTLCLVLWKSVPQIFGAKLFAGAFGHEGVYPGEEQPAPDAGPLLWTPSRPCFCRDAPHSLSLFLSRHASSIGRACTRHCATLRPALRHDLPGDGAASSVGRGEYDGPSPLFLLSG